MASTNIFESNALQLGERGTEKAHRRVELQSPEDFSYLIANVQQAAREKLARDLPPNATGDGEDEMRKRVAELVDEYIHNTFTSAKDSIMINGMDSKELEAELAKAQEGEEIEPFDAKLAQRVQALAAQIENHTLELANLRRTAPAETSKQFQDAFEQQSALYDARLQMDEEVKLEAARSTRLDVGKVERLDDMQNTYQTGSEKLQVLKSGLGGTVAKMEKAQRAVDILENP